MIIPLDLLNAFEGNKFEFSKASMMAVSRLNNIKDYPEPDHNWKIVPNILKLMLDGSINFDHLSQLDFVQPAPVEEEQD